MVNKLAKLYGDPIALHPNGDAKQALDHFPELGYAFPTLPQLSAAQDELETALREHLFGYRAKSIRLVFPWINLVVVPYCGQDIALYGEIKKAKQTQALRPPSNRKLQ